MNKFIPKYKRGGTNRSQYDLIMSDRASNQSNGIVLTLPESERREFERQKRREQGKPKQEEEIDLNSDEWQDAAGVTYSPAEPDPVPDLNLNTEAKPRDEIQEGIFEGRYNGKRFNPTVVHYVLEKHPDNIL